MQTTIDIDEDILQAARERADATGRTTGEVISELARFALVSGRVDRLPRQDRDPQLDFDPEVVIAGDTIDELLDAIERDDTLGYPLSIDDTTRQQIRKIAEEQGVSPGKIAADLAQNTLLEKGAWPLRDGVAVFPIRGREPLTLEEIDTMLDEL